MSVALPCSALSDALGEDMGGSAPADKLILVVEQSGPWGRDALKESGLRPIAGELAAHAAAAGARVQVIRRATRRYTDPCRFWLAGVAPGERFLERLDVDDAAGILDVELRRGAGRPDDELLLLACTHSTRDPCCARLGLPLHRALTASGARTWHSSHLGGHRFAATMAALPLGAWLGRVPVDAVPGVVERLREGRLPLEYMRGLAGRPPAVQVAELAVRRELGVDGVDDVLAEGLEGDLVTLRVGSQRYVVSARLEPTGEERPVSCGEGAKIEDPGRWVVSVDRA